MIKVVLISVGIDNKYGNLSAKANKHRIITPMLAIPYLSAIISNETDTDLQVIDEAHGLIDENNLPQADIVGLSGMTMHAKRMYKLARIFKQKGSYVVLGGIHASFMVEEALEYGDSVVIGEGLGYN